jgi:hypothetical protein
MYETLTHIPVLLKKLRGKQRLLWVSATLATGLSVSLIFGFIGAFVETVAWLDPAWRQPVFVLTLSGMISSLVLVLIYFGYLLFRPGYPDDNTLATTIWKSDPEIRDRILDAIQLATNPDPNTSHALRIKALEDIDNEAANLDHSAYLNHKWFRLSLKVFASVSGFLLLAFLVAGNLLLPGVSRLFHPTDIYLKPGTVLLSMDMPDSITIINGDDLPLAAKARHNIPGSVTFFLDEGSGAISKLDALREQEDSSRFTARLEKIQRNLMIYAESGKANSDTVFVEVTPRPRIARLEVSVKPPAYTQLPVVRLPESVGDISGLPGSIIGIKLESSRILAKASLVVKKESGATSHIDLEALNRTAKGSFKLRENGGSSLSRRTVYPTTNRYVGEWTC